MAIETKLQNVAPDNVEKVLLVHRIRSRAATVGLQAACDEAKIDRNKVYQSAHGAVQRLRDDNSGAIPQEIRDAATKALAIDVAQTRGRSPKAMGDLSKLAAINGKETASKETASKK